MKQNLGTTNAGTGQLTTFGVVTKAAFTSSRPTMAYVSYNNVHGAAYSNRYESQVAKKRQSGDPPADETGRPPANTIDNCGFR
ncbi:hypothetical protein [Secundilactobacillus collinoides]|uniref:hypothetical protein n=1 Tax=Secundilactobacillus collinoides TaxID=33960 RepID=UPI001FB51CFB|nr:hypothetical protein [Secundilactobacillus collinoides]